MIGGCFMSALAGSLVLFVLTGPAGDQQAPPLAAWHGVWRGKLVIADAADKTSEHPVVFRIGPLQSTRNLTWQLTVGEGEISDLRSLKLLPDGEKPGRFRLEEPGGGTSAARLVNGVIHNQAETRGRLRTVRYELRGDVLRYEVIWSRPSQEKGRGYEIEVIQRADLRKK
jgi:hypothetical protein